ncbi:MAG: helix-turn-helix domain-containing protein [Candidatus Rhabdochlamydia sp.]
MTPEEIQSIRLSLGVSQEKFASLLGTTVVSVNRWENGKTKPSRLYVKEIKELRNNHGAHIRRRKESEKS